MTLRFAVVGCGSAARRIHLPVLRTEGVEVTAFASRSPASAEAARDEWGSGAVEARWEDAIVRDDVDAVVVATPNVLHAPVAIAAALAGKHVLVDKPMACTAADADEMIAAAERGGVVLVPFQNARFAAPFAAAHAAVAAGVIGAVTGVRAAFGHGGPQTWAPHATWFFDRALSGGGCLLDLGVHAVDLVRHVTGDDVAAVGAFLTAPAGGVEVDAQLLLRMRGGAIGTIHTSWSSPCGTDHQLTVVGAEATLHLDTRTPLALAARDGSTTRLALPDTTGSPLAELLAAVRGERPPSLDARDGRAAVAVVDAAYRSAREGVIVGVA